MKYFDVSNQTSIRIIVIYFYRFITGRTGGLFIRTNGAILIDVIVDEVEQYLRYNCILYHDTYFEIILYFVSRIHYFIFLSKMLQGTSYILKLIKIFGWKIVENYNTQLVTVSCTFPSLKMYRVFCI